jgi:adenylate cyclase
LSAILAGDVVGYSRLMEQDEAGTFTRLRAHRKDLIEPKVERHHGRIFKLVGDGFLAEFGSVIDAVECAVDLQRALSDQNQGTPATQRIEIRIGITLGDVIVEGDDRHGEGVNVAARLEGLSDPGGILISGSAFDQVAGKLDCEFEDLGEQHLKNIEKRVRIYRVKLGGKPLAKAATAAGRHHRTRLWWVVPAAALVLAIGGGVTWGVFFAGWRPFAEVAAEGKMAFPLPDKPSIAVLPFTNMSSEPGQEHFADGMTDDVITDLSKSSALFVIARNSTFAYKGKTVKISEVAETLGVRYVLEGSVQRAGGKLRVNAQLIDALTGGHVWADRFDGKVDDIFAVQDEFVRKIVEALEVRLTAGEKAEIARSKPNNVTAKEAFDEGWNFYSNLNAKDNVAAIGRFEKAVELDPAYGRGYAALALAYYRMIDYYWCQELGMSAQDVYAKFQYNLQLAEKYPTALAYVVRAHDDVAYGRAEDAVGDAGRAIALDPNDPEAHIMMALALTISDKPQEALNFVDTAIRLNPSYPSHYVLARGIALMTAGDLAQAERVLDEGFKRNPEAISLLIPLASVLAQLGRTEEARQALQTWWPQPGQTIPTDYWDNFEFPVRGKTEFAKMRERLYDGLRVASLPAGVTVSSLVTELQQNSPFRRQVAAKQLGWFGSAAAAAVPALTEALGDKMVQNYAAQFLGKIGPAATAAIPALEALQNESVTGAYARDALKEIRGKNP